MKTAFAASLLFLLLVVASAPTADADAIESFESPDGVAYTYITYGSDHSEYRAEMASASSGSETVILASSLEGYEVRDITGRLDLPNARTVVVPEFIERISSDAFVGCTALESVLFMGPVPSIDGGLPEGVVQRMLEDEKIAEESPDGSVVEYLILGDSAMAVGGKPSGTGSIEVAAEVSGIKVGSIGAYAFAGRDAADRSEVVPRDDVKRVTIPEGVEVLRERCFYYCGALQSVEIPDSVRLIMDESFRACTSLKNAEIPGGTEYLGFESFRHCTQLTSICIPDSVRFIGEGAFKVCRSASSISVGEGLHEIGDWAFAYCSSATRAELSDSVESIGSSAFYLCTSLRAFEAGSVESIGEDAFFGCAVLSSFEPGDSLEDIGRGAFRECSSLQSLRMPETLLSIGDKAFAYCTGLEDVYFDGDMPDFGNAVFLSCDATVHCTEEHADSWKGYEGVVADSDTGTSYAFMLAVIAAVASAVVIVMMIRRMR